MAVISSQPPVGFICSKRNVFFKAGAGIRKAGASLDQQIAGAAAMMQKIKGLNKVGDKVRTDTVVKFNN